MGPSKPVATGISCRCRDVPDPDVAVSGRGLPAAGTCAGSEAGDMEARRTDPVLDVAVLSVAGELDIASAGAVQRDATRLLQANGPDLVIDLSGVTFMDSSGLAALVAVRQTCST